MSGKRPSSLAARATVFAALGDQMRLSLLVKLAKGQRYSIAQLSEGTNLTRQAITKHLRVLEEVRLVHARREGRESRFELDLKPVAELKVYLEALSKRWDASLSRLKVFVERDQP